MNEIERPDSVRELARGIAVRAGILGVAGVVVGAVAFGAAAKAASGAVKILAGLLLVSAGVGLAAWEVKKARRQWAGGPDSATLARRES
ncbi:MAG TPA: hypothetical protein VF111_00105 [Thermoanaerobaculia bacterium]